MSRDAFRPRTPAPLRSSQTPNLASPAPSSQPYSFLNDSPSHFLAPKEGSVKLKVKSGISPEARSRVGAGAGGLRPVTPRPVKSRLGVATSTPMPSAGTSKLSNNVKGALRPSESEESLNAYAVDSEVGVMDAALDAEGEALGEHETVLVSVRVRPPNTTEQRRGESESVWGTDEWNPQTIKLGPGQGRENRDWTFDRILDTDTDNSRAYAMSAKTHVRRAMEGYNALIFAYGQTASGKTHTLSGSPSAPGIIPLAIHDLFHQIRSSPDREFLLRASYLELYNETLIDLLSADGRELSLSEGKKKGEVVVNGLTECAVRTEEEVRRLLAVGEENRKVGKTDWNARSSRSHCVFRIVVESRASKNDDGTRTPGGKSAGDKMTRISTLSIIDLAGSEKHTSSKERNAEGKHINQSLLTLKLVISKLADMASKRNVTHVPYRDSKLTRLLQPSLSGDALISVICTLSPSPQNLNESLSTLSFAQGLKRVILRAQRKEVLDPQALIQQYQVEIAELKSMLREREMGGGGAAASGAISYDAMKGGKKESNNDMEKRLEELKSLILTGDKVQGGSGSKGGRPVSPKKLNGPTLGYDKSTAQLREDLHAAQLKTTKLQDDNIRLKYELEARHAKPDERIMTLMDEVAGLKMIAEDYERNLLEPSRKVKEDVEREWKGKVDKLEQQLENKQIWACRLDDKVRALTEENATLKNRCSDAEHKVHAIIDWLNVTLNPTSSSSSSSPDRPGPSDPRYKSTINGSNMPSSESTLSIPELVVEAPAEDGDFGPAPTTGTSASARGRSTLTLNARMTRDKISHMDLASLSEKFGSLGVRARKGEMRMLREESGWDLSGVASGAGGGRGIQEGEEDEEETF